VHGQSGTASAPAPAAKEQHSNAALHIWQTDMRSSNCTILAWELCNNQANQKEQSKDRALTGWWPDVHYCAGWTRDDPTILGWELCNEPRCEGDFSGSILQDWVECSAEFLKSLDPHHLLTIGTEGFLGSSTPGVPPNAQPTRARECASAFCERGERCNRGLKTNL